MTEKHTEKADDNAPEKQFTPLEVLLAIVAFLWFLLTQGVFNGKARPSSSTDADLNRGGDAVTTDTGQGSGTGQQPKQD